MGSGSVGEMAKTDNSKQKTGWGGGGVWRGYGQKVADLGGNETHKNSANGLASSFTKFTFWPSAHVPSPLHLAHWSTFVFTIFRICNRAVLFFASFFQNYI